MQPSTSKPYSYEKTKTVELFRSADLLTKIEKDFEIVIRGQKLTYDTPIGVVTVKTRITDKKLTTVILLTQDEFGKYKAKCGHEHDWKLCSGHPALVNFCRSKMLVKFKGEFKDTQLLEKIKAFVKKHNDICEVGVTSFMTTIGNEYVGFIDNEGVFRGITKCIPV